VKRIAILVPGGLGDVNSGVHISVLFELIERLSQKYEIIAFSHRLPDTQPTVSLCGNAVVKFLDVTHSNGMVRRAFVFLRELYKEHHKKKFDLLHGFWVLPWGLFVVLAGNFLGIQTVVSVCGGETANLPDINYGSMRKPLQRFLVFWICRKAESVIVNSAFQIQQLSAWNFYRTDIACIPPGVNTKKFYPNNLRKSGPPYHFLHIGDIRPVKDQETLLRAFALISSRTPSTLAIIGRDFLDGKLQQLAAELQILDRVEFLGYVSHDNIPQYLSRAHVLLHSSIHEGAAVVVAEAAASGVLVCGTRVGLLYDLADDIVTSTDVGDSRSLAIKTLELLSNGTAMKEKQTKALQWAKKHDIDWCAEQHLNVYKKLFQ